MKTEKVVYFVNGFLPSDEDKVCVSIFKLAKISDRYYWDCITRDSGIGFGSNDYKGYESEKDALINIHNYSDDVFKVIECTFEEVVTLALNIESRLHKQLEIRIQENGKIED